MHEAPRYATLRDYLRVLRQQRVLIVVVALVFAGAALGLAIRQDPKYEAVASVNFTDEVQGLDLVGNAPSPRQTPAERAAVGAGRMRRLVVAERVRRALGTTQPPAALLGIVRVEPEGFTNLVRLTATSTDPAFAARVANAFAEEGRVVIRREARQRFARAARDLERRYRSASRRATDPFTRSVFEDRVARLRFLAATAQPVELLQRAGVPSRPFSPRPVRNTLLGLLLGLTVGLLLAFGRDSLDRRLHGTTEIQRELGWPVIGHVRDQALGSAGPVSANGGPRAEDADLEAFRILRQNLEFLDVKRPPSLIVVTSALPEEGKSTVAASLACAYALSGQRTLLVECDLRRPTLGARLGLAPGPGLADYLLGEVEPPSVLQTVPLGPPAGRNGSGAEGAAAATLVTITAGKATSNPAELLGSQRMIDFLEQVTDAYDAVIVDTCPLLSVVDTIGLLPHVEGVLLCVRTTQTTREQARAAHEVISRAPERPVGIVVTGLKAGDERDFAYYGYAYSYAPEDV